MPNFHVYLRCSHTRVLYIGMTGDLQRRVLEHKTKAAEGFTEKYNVNQLGYYEEVEDAESAFARERQLKRWTRAKKIALIERMNPRWFDLSDRWYTEVPTPPMFGQMTVQSLADLDPSTTASTPALRT